MFAATAPTRALTAPQTGLMSGWTGAMAMPAAEMAGCVFAVQLIDRRTGSVHRINGAPLIVFTRQPDEAAADLLRNRDTRVWTTRSEALPKGAWLMMHPGALTILGQIPALPQFLRKPRAPQTTPKENTMFATITLAGQITAQGTRIADHADGRVTISTGAQSLTGWPVARSIKGTLSALALVLFGLAAPQGVQAETLLNVSYDPTRELYREFNEAFAKHWEAEGNAAPTIETSHGGSGAQARAVIDGLEAQVVTLALASDIDKIAAAGKLPADWQTKLPHNASPYTSTIVFLVREGNPKGLKDWGDLVGDGVEVITPNPKTSGGARWNYLAAWAWAEKNGKDPKAFVGDLFKHVPVLDSGARGSTTTFSQRGIGDVLLAWENEAYLALKELGEDQFDIVVPSVSVLAEPPVALVEANIKTDEQRKLATAYLDFLYSPEGQAIAFKNFYRAWDASAANADDVARFPKLDLVDIASFGGWAKVQPEHFGDGGIFDQIYVPK